VDRPRLPTVAGTQATGYVVVLVWCRPCRHQGFADLAALVAGGRGDVPLVQLRWRCGRCRSDRVDFVCTSRDALRVVPWRGGATPR